MEGFTEDDLPCVRQNRGRDWNPKGKLWRAAMKKQLNALVDGCSNGTPDEAVIYGVIVRLLLLIGWSYADVGRALKFSDTQAMYLAWGQRRKPELRKKFAKRGKP